MIDLHTHLWPHEPGTTLPGYDELARYCDVAAGLGVQQIAITEHCNRFEEIATAALQLWRRDDMPLLRGSSTPTGTRRSPPNGNTEPSTAFGTRTPTP